MPCDNMDIVEKTVERRRAYTGLILTVDRLTNALPNGRQAPREVIRHIGASAVLPVDENGDVWLVRQFRAPVNRVLLEIPAGKLDAPGEDRLVAARRELLEETGLTAREWTHLTDILTTPGFTDEKISLYLARGLTAGESHPDEDEFLNVVRLPLGEVLSRIMAGEITDAKTICAALMADRVLNG